MAMASGAAGEPVPPGVANDKFTVAGVLVRRPELSKVSCVAPPHTGGVARSGSGGRHGLRHPGCSKRHRRWSWVAYRPCRRRLTKYVVSWCELPSESYTVMGCESV